MKFGKIGCVNSPQKPDGLNFASWSESKFHDDVMEFGDIIGVELLAMSTCNLA